MKKLLTNLMRDEEGATMVEYGIMVALIAVVSIVAIGLLGGKVNDAFETVEGAFPTPTP